jgi:hypothetical protein
MYEWCTYETNGFLEVRKRFHGRDCVGVFPELPKCDNCVHIEIQQKRKDFVSRFKKYALNLCRFHSTALQLVEIYEKGLDDARYYLVENRADASADYLVSEFKMSMKYYDSDLRNERTIDAYKQGLDDGRFYVYCKKGGSNGKETES